MAVREQISGRWFQIREREDPDGGVRLILLGHLDAQSAQKLASRLRRLSRRRVPARLDLSQLARIDPGGADSILAVLGAAHRSGWKLELLFV